MIFKIISPKMFAKKLAFFTQNKAKFKHWFLKKRQFVGRKLSKIAENCDHSIDPWLHEIQFCAVCIKLADSYRVFVCASLLWVYLSISLHWLVQCFCFLHMYKDHGTCRYSFFISLSDYVCNARRSLCTRRDLAKKQSKRLPDKILAGAETVTIFESKSFPVYVMY
jgi:hypothetical protein